jgi:hypothetical protein
MSKIKISHEVPFCLLEQSLEFNNYQYALPHLLESNEEYRQHFLKCKEDGVEIYLDNSLHEIGYAMDDTTLIKWMEILEPSTFFIPDVWENKDKSIINAERWSTIEVPEGVTKCAVVQAKSQIEAMRCTEAYQDLGYKKIAYSYGASYYNDVCPHPNKDLGKAIGRFMTINALYDLGVLLPTNKIHLLGTSSPIEFGLYKDIDCIESIDTSNPVMAGIDLTMYGDLGLSEKPIANMNSYQDKQLSQTQLKMITHNVKMFRQINGL